MNTVLERAPQAPAAAPAPQQVKCVVWDLDHTLWDGVLSEGDPVALKPGIRELLAALDARGILHSIASKNSHGDAMAQLEKFGIAHYFLYPQISWNPKSAAIGRIRESLNIGMDTLLFIDDQPFERDEAAAAHPALACMAAEDYASLPGDARLNPAVITEDAARRRLMYLEDIARQQEEDQFTGTPEAFLATLGMTLTIAPAGPADLMRAEELTLRTNQLNSTGVTYDMAQLRAYMDSPSHQLLVCELTDKYGSYGKIGLALIERCAAHDHIMLLLMSCRTVSRGIGSVLLSWLMNQAAAAGKRLRADFRRTERNRQMLVTYQLSNFREISRSDDGRIVFENSVSAIAPYPPYLRLQAPEF